ncbi:hypothetical protein GGR58DRAFT_508619 [Xylaria digitata]|nr:hypothetical protein GGR58DRAFT_508619 [Xylaria digitata]
MSLSKSYSIASIPADGIGPEVIDAAIKVLDSLAETLGSFALNFTHYDWSSETYRKTGEYIPDGGLEQLRNHDAILFGAVGAPDVPDHISLWGLRLAICQPFQQYANVRPTKVFRGTQSPLRNCKTGDLDWVIIRENSEGEAGSAFDITGMGVANPVASFWTSAEMLAWLGEKDASRKLLDSVERVCEKGITTADLGGTAKTVDVTRAVIEDIVANYGKGGK